MPNRDKKTNVVPIILLVIGTILSFVCIFTFPSVLKNADDEELIGLLILALLFVLVGFILFSIGWFWHAAKKIRWRASFGWWLFSIGTWFEIFFIRWLAPDIECSTLPTTGEHWCEPSIHFIVLSFVVPAIVMILGLILVFIGKKKKNKQPSSQPDISPR